MHGESVRQRNVRPDNAMDRAGTWPLDLCEADTVLKQKFEFTERHGKSPSGNIEPLNSDNDVSDSFSASVSDSVVLETTLSMIRATSLGRIGTLTSRISDFLQGEK